MSLVAAALRAVFVKAIHGRTSAGEALDAPKEPITRIKDAAIIAVYTGAYRFKPNGRNLYGTFGLEKTQELVVQITLPPGDVTVEGVNLNMSDGGSGLAMDIIWRQIVDAISDPANPWADTLGHLVEAYTGFNSAPVLIETERGVRYPCREVSMHCMVTHDPGMGKPLAGAWQTIYTALKADDDTAPIADLIKLMAERPDDMPVWRITQAREGMTEAEVRALGAGPADDTADEMPVISDVIFGPVEDE